MPSINRIRVNNVKYNFGTQQYDDFTMRMYGKNTLYDLANGGGKSILMLLLLQNLIPNCTLDEKQPVEKLFRTGGGNTTIHSLIEWKLDEPELHEGYRYMTTGFCARKAKDSPDEEDGGKEMAAIEYFNYCILYRDYNENDIINLPLVKDGERVSYTGWKNYLKELGRRDMKLSVQVFDRKGEYQRYISQFGLYESHWEIIRGINKTEGHVRTYFETNYKTARKVVEDLLIEEIIEKAYLVKIDKNADPDDMAHTLLEIKDKLVELTKKKREIADYDRQTELLHVLEARVAAFLELYEKQSDQCANLANVCVTGATLAKQSEEKLKALELAKDEKKKIIRARQKQQANLKIHRDKLEYRELLAEIERLQAEIAGHEQSVKDCQQELNRKESINDYLDYWKDKSQKEEHEAVIEASLHQNDDQLSLLKVLVKERRKRDEQILKTLSESEKQAEEDYQEAEGRLSSSENLTHEAEVAFAVAEHEEKQASERYAAAMEELQALRKKMTFTSLQNPETLLEEQTAQAEQEKIHLTELENQVYEIQNLRHEKLKECEKRNQELDQIIARIEELKTGSREYQEQADKLKRMLEIYGGQAAEKSAEWMTNADMGRLSDQINQRYLDNLAMISNVRKQITAQEKRLQGLAEGRLVAPTEAVDRVKYYIESRHNRNAVFGMDYLAAQPEERRSHLLALHPLLPYGLLVDTFEGLDNDRKLRELNLGDGFLPIYNMERLENTAEKIPEDGVIFLQRGTQAFVSTEAIEEEKERRQTELEELQNELERLEEMNRTYQEDSTFVAGLQGIAVLDVEQELLKAQEELREEQNAVALCTQELEDTERELEQLRSQLTGCKQAVYSKLEEQGQLRTLVSLSERTQKAEKDLQTCKAEQERLDKLLEEHRQALHHWKVRYADTGKRLQELRKQRQERTADWEQYYKTYYDENAAGTKEQCEQVAALDKEQLDARLKAQLSVVEKGTVALEDKKKLITTLQASMSRFRKAIEKRGNSMEELEKLRQTNELFTVDERDLELLSTELSRLTLAADALKHHVEGRRQKADRLEGKIEQAIRTMEEQFGPCEELQVSVMEIDAELETGEQQLNRLNTEYQQMETDYAEDTREYTAILDLYKDVKRIVETNDIRLQDAKALVVGKEQLRELFEQSLLAYDKSTKALDRARGELQRYKNQTAQALLEMQAFELSQTISNDVAVPKNYGEARNLRESLSSIINVIALEKERVAQGIEDMQFIKSNFEKQCVQRCQDVKNELEKLPKLSRIMLDGEAIQMVGLTIPYVKEEFIQQRMSDYIDDVVQGADRFQNQNERIKYIRSRLELKKLFSVLVTDMNNIRLTLYKRERIKEQSRYLRYEEAVGSTGQSQGIYIQFLISIINYISGLYAPNGENDKRMKTIFIDNPFGAAKDVYIWEPIFALLKTNHVQLIVPARGATPAITARFEVNYVLGQQMVGKRQQTVVVDYRSQVDQEELEYHSLEYEQVSFDFI